MSTPEQRAADRAVRAVMMGEPDRARRTRGTGGISKRTMRNSKGQPYTLFEGTVTIDGKRRSVYGRKQSDVEAKLKALQTPAAPVVTNGHKTVEQYLAEWLEIICPTIAPTTCRTYTMIVNAHLVPALGSIKLDRLTSADVAKMLRDRPDRSPRTLHHLRSVLRNALQRAVDAGTLPRNVAAGRGVGVPKQRDTKDDRVILTPANIARLLDAAQADRLRALYITALNIGARQGELLGLVWSDVDFGKGTIAISKQLQRVGGELVRQSLKTSGSRRTVTMSAAVRAALMAHRDRQAGERALAGKRWQSEPDYVFRTEDGKGHDGVQVTKHFQDAVEAAGLPYMHFHDLRHTCASILLAAGAKLHVVSHLLGHASPTVTLNIYGHMMPSQDTDAADIMERALQV